MAHKLMASKEGAYLVLVSCLKNNSADKSVILAALKAMISLMDGQPDILTSESIDIMNR